MRRAWASGLAGLVAIAAGCRSSAPPAPRDKRAAAAAQLVPAPASADDVIVAQVNGRPVYASCVAAQAAHGHLDARAGLQECIGFELLAQSAEARGLATNPTVIEATRTALVNRLVELGFERTHRTPADLAAELDAVLARDPRGTADVITVPEMRMSAYARVIVPTRDPPARVEQARVVAQAIYESLAAQPGLLSADLADAMHRAGDGKGFELAMSEVPLHTRAYFEEAFGRQLFEGTSEVGRVNPPVRTSLGWDVMLLLDRREPHPLTRDERIAEVFPGVRRLAFQHWVDELIRALHVTIKLDAKRADELLDSSEGS